MVAQSRQSSGFTFSEAVEGLRAGDFSRLAPLFGDADAPERQDSQITTWADEGAFEGAPDALAEALTCACWLGQTGVATHLLDRGVDPAGGAMTGLDALHWAANRGQLAAVRLLLDRGAPLETRNRFDGTPLGVTIWSAFNEPRAAHVSIVEALLDAGADPFAVDYPTGDAAIDALLARHRGQHTA